jgi:hypothetical protein
MKKSYKINIPKYKVGAQEITSLAPVATSLAINFLGDDATNPTTQGFKQGLNIASYGAQLGTSINPGIGTAIGAGAGALIGGTMGVVSANKNKRNLAVKNNIKAANKANSQYMAENPDAYQTDIYALGGQINAPIIEVEKGEVITNSDNDITHTGVNPHSNGGDKLLVYPKGFKSKTPHAIAGGTVYSTQYSDKEREQIVKNVNKVKYPMSSMSKKRATKVLDFMADREGNPEGQYNHGGPIYANGVDEIPGFNKYMRSPLNTAGNRERNQYLSSLPKESFIADNYQPGPAVGGMLPLPNQTRALQEPLNLNASTNVNGPVIDSINTNTKYAGGPSGSFVGYNDATLKSIFSDNASNNNIGPVNSTPYPARVDTSVEMGSSNNINPGMFKFRHMKPSFLPQRNANNDNIAPTEQGGKFGGGPGAGNTGMNTNSALAASQTGGVPSNTTSTKTNKSERFNLDNLSRYAAPLYNTALGMTKPEYPTMENVSFKLNTNPEKLLLPSRIRAARNKYSMLKNQANGNLTVAQRMGILNSVGSDFNNDLQSIYGNFAASEANTQNSNNQIINQQDAMNREINYKNADAKLRAKSANRNLVSTGLSQLTDIGQLNTKNKNQMSIDKIRTLIYKDIIPNVGNSKAAQTLLEELNQLGYND